MISEYLTPKQIERCEEMIAKGAYLTDKAEDGSNLILMRYFQDNGIAKEEAFNKWLPIYESRYGKYDVNYSFFPNSLFDGAWKRASSMRPLSTVKVYENELNYINATICDRWVKELMLFILVDCKISKRYKFATAFFNQLVNYTSVPRKCSANRQKAVNEMISVGVLSYEQKERADWITGETDIFENYVFNFPKGNGNVAFEVGRVCDTVDYLDMITMLRPCIKCGAMFEYNSKTQRDVCEECWRKGRRDSSRLCMEALRASKNRC